MGNRVISARQCRQVRVSEGEGVSALPLPSRWHAQTQLNSTSAQLPDFTEEAQLKMRDGKKTVLVINGPNLNLLGTREPQVYGHETLANVEAAGKAQGEQLNANISFFQTYTQYLT